MDGSYVRSQLLHRRDTGHLPESPWEAPAHLETNLAPTGYSRSWREMWCLHRFLTPTPPGSPAPTLYSPSERVHVTGTLSTSLQCCCPHGILNSRADAIRAGKGAESCASLQRSMGLCKESSANLCSLPLGAREDKWFTGGGVTGSSASWEKGKQRASTRAAV